MNHLCGGSSVLERRRASHLEVASSNLAPRSTLLRAFAAGLQLDAAARAAGRKDGEEGAGFRPLDFDAFSYACGFAEGKRIRGNRR